MIKSLKSPGLLTIFLSIVVCAQGRDNLLQRFGLGSSDSTNSTYKASSALSSLSQDQVSQGLKEALGQGVQRAITMLGHDGGFLTNVNVRIPMPEKLHTVERTLRSMKQDKLADQFVATMNHAAEQAVPEAVEVFTSAVKEMSVADAKAILLGGTNSATEYFRRSTSSNLFDRFLPVVKKATDSTGVTSTYKKMMDRVGGSSKLGAFSTRLLGDDAMNVDNYVTTKALEGLFKMIAEEEKRIRENPTARSSELLQKVFGAIKTPR